MPLPIDIGDPFGLNDVSDEDLRNELARRSQGLVIITYSVLEDQMTDDTGVFYKGGLPMAMGLVDYARLFTEEQYYRAKRLPT